MDNIYMSCLGPWRMQSYILTFFPAITYKTRPIIYCPQFIQVTISICLAYKIYVIYSKKKKVNYVDIRN